MTSAAILVKIILINKLRVIAKTFSNLKKYKDMGGQESKEESSDVEQKQNEIDIWNQYEDQNKTGSSSLFGDMDTGLKKNNDGLFSDMETTSGDKNLFDFLIFFYFWLK